MLQFRGARAEDRNAVNQLWQAGDMVLPSDDQWRALTSNGCARLLVAEEDGIIIGAAIAAYDGWRGFVYSRRRVGTPPAWRGHRALG